MDVNGRCRLISVLIFWPMLLSAQSARQHDPAALKHLVGPSVLAADTSQ